MRFKILYRYNKKNKKRIKRIINGATLIIGTPYIWDEKIIYNIVNRSDYGINPTFTNITTEE